MADRMETRGRIVTTGVNNVGALEARYRERSLWLSGIAEPLTPRRSLPGDVGCDAAIVGAGFTGLWTAYYLKQHDPALRVVVVEREIAGFGPSGRNGGWVMSGISGSARAYGERPESDAMVRAARETQAAVDEVGRVVEAEAITCGYRKVGAVTVATSEPQRSRLLTYASEHNDPGAHDLTLGPGELEQFVRIPGVLASSYTPHAARIDPARLALGLASACELLGVQIYERTSAREIAPGRILCDGGTVRADTVLRATEAYTTQLSGQHLRYLPLYSLMIATEPLSEDVWDELGWRDGLLVGDLHHLFFYAQRTTDGRIAIGGRGAPYRLREPISERNERSAEVARRLVQTVRRHFPAAADAAITHHWGGPLAVPRDWSMSVSFDAPSRVGWAGGYSGHGVGASNIAGRTLADLALGRDTDLVTLPWVQHKSRRWEPEPLRFVASRAIVKILGRADRREDATGRRSQLTRLVAPFMPPR
jgi:glycine/D-amino acid oxidase-like deaminating enzyme